MDIAAMSTVLSQSNVQQQASLSIMKMAMGVETTSGDLITALAGQPTQSIHPILVANLDIQA